jgi:adenosylhomocysteine nucleosidase
MTADIASGPKPRPVFIAALPREIASIVSRRGWRAEEKLLARNIHLFEHRDAIIACAGMGVHRASLAVEAALALGPVSELVSVGWAGACNNWRTSGDVVRANIVVDARTGERFFTEEKRQGIRGQEVVVTVASPASVKEKERLSLSYYASAVDMEAAAVARIARARELPFYAIKAISDGHDFELPDMSRFTTADGQFREGAFALHVAVRPQLWKLVLTLAKSSKLAAKHLSAEIAAHTQDRDRQT